MSPILISLSRLESRYGQLLPIGAIVPAVLRRYQLELPPAAPGETPLDASGDSVAVECAYGAGIADRESR